jgi:tetratricopeptide (TPR) repeat protein
VWIAPVAVFVITFLVFRPSLDGAFLNWDDDHNFLKNEHYRGLAWENLRWMFTTFHLGPYQPLSWLSLGVDYVFWGMDPWGYHLTNVLLHAVNAALVYLLAMKLFLMADPGARPSWRLQAGAAAAALLFALHPLRVESVAWITERRDVLSGLFAFLALIAYVEGARPLAARARLWNAAAFVLFVLSLLSKASAMTLPIVLLAFDVWLLRRPLGQSAAGKIPYVVAGAAIAVLALFGQKTIDSLSMPYAEGPLLRLSHGLFAVAWYVKATLVPAGLSPLYELPFRANPFAIQVIASTLVVLGISAGVWLARRRWPALFVAWMAYVILILPVSGIGHPGGQILTDRFTYLPMIGFALLAGYLVWTWRPALWLGAAAVAALAIATTQQIPIWADSLSLWRQAWIEHPLERLRASGASADDIREMESRIVALGKLSAHHVIALKYAEALREAGRLAEADAVLARGADASPNEGDIYTNWGAVLLELRQFDRAAAMLEKAVAIDPNAQASFNLGIARSAIGDRDGAIAAYTASLALDDGNAVAHYNLGVLLADASRLDEAAAHYRRAIAIQPRYPEAFNNLGVALGRQGRTAEAINAFRQAVALDPSNESARRNLAAAMKLAGGG